MRIASATCGSGEVASPRRRSGGRSRRARARRRRPSTRGRRETMPPSASVGSTSATRAPASCAATAAATPAAGRAERRRRRHTKGSSSAAPTRRGDAELERASHERLEIVRRRRRRAAGSPSAVEHLGAVVAQRALGTTRAGRSVRIACPVGDRRERELRRNALDHRVRDDPAQLPLRDAGRVRAAARGCRISAAQSLTGKLSQSRCSWPA